MKNLLPRFTLILALCFLVACSKSSNSISDTSDSACINEKPIIIPEIKNWTGHTGYFDLTQTEYIFYDSKCKSIATLLTEEIYETCGTRPVLAPHKNMADIENGNSIFLILEHEDVNNEEYTLSIDSNITITGNSDDGVFWGTRTLLQMLVQNPLIPCGTIQDTPSYKVRGLGIDVARKPVSIDTLKEVIILMSWYKMNDLHLHLNDNALMPYVYSNHINAYSAFRLESDIHNDNGVYLTSTDYYYTKSEFIELIQFAQSYHINIVPELDTPSHSLAITKVFPELAPRITDGNVENLDLNNPDVLPLVKRIWNEYTTTTFTDCETVHIGLDESFSNADLYYQYMNELSSNITSKNKTVRVWGSLSRLISEQPLNTENIQLNIWKTFWANPLHMMDMGFDIINSQSHQLYLIPGGGYDYLNTEHIYNHFQPNIFEAETWQETTIDTIVLEPDNEQLLGAAMFVWNDMACDYISLDITEYDIYHRILDVIPYFSQKVWNIENSHTYEEFANNITQISAIPHSEYLLSNTDISKRVLTPPYTLSFDITINLLEELVLFENDSAYATHSFSIKKDDSGHYLSCETEYKIYDFIKTDLGKERFYIDPLIESNKPFHVSVTANMGTLQISINDCIVLDAGSNIKFEQHATFLFPMEMCHKSVNNIVIE